MMMVGTRLGKQPSVAPARVVWTQRLPPSTHMSPFSPSPTSLEFSAPLALFVPCLQPISALFFCFKSRRFENLAPPPHAHPSCRLLCALLRCMSRHVRIPVARHALPRVHGGFWEAYSMLREKVLAALAVEMQVGRRHVAVVRCCSTLYDPVAV